MGRWTEKYAPKDTAGIVGQTKAIEEITSFINDFKKSKKKAVLLHGPPGVGKTSSIYAIAEEKGLEVLEVNASDTRNKANIEEILGSATKTSSLFGGSKLILVDEVDGIAGNQDRGGIPALVKVIEESRFPMILTCNDPTHKKFSPLRSKTKIITFEPLSKTDVISILRHIAEKENIDYDKDCISHIATMTNGDLRGSINDLQSLSGESKRLSKDDLPILGEREYRQSIKEALLRIFKLTDVNEAITALDLVDEDYDAAMLWLEENIPREYRWPGERFRAFEALAKADVMRGRIRRRQYWRFLVYINAYLTGGIASAKTETHKEVIDYRESMRPLKIWQANMANMKRNSIAQKLARHCHTSSRRAMNDILPYFAMNVKAQRSQANSFLDRLDISDEERDWLLKKA